jgi:hypothetical protein
MLAPAWLSGAALAAEPDFAPPAELRGEWPAATSIRQGGGRLRYLGLAVYDISLWSTEPVVADAVDRTPLALCIRYRLALSGRRIAERSLREMQRGGALAAADSERWLAEMVRLFPDVSEGDRITGVQWPGRGGRFHLNGRLLGEVQDARFATRFFGLWLAPWTSKPELRRQLLGAEP